MYQVKGSLFVNSKEISVAVLVQSASSLIEAIEIATKELEMYECVAASLTKIKEVYAGDVTHPWFEVALRASEVDPNDSNKSKRVKYKILIQAETIEEAHKQAQEIIRQGYSMTIDGIKDSHLYTVI